MTTKRKIIIDEEEFEVHLLNDGDVWRVIVDGNEFSVKTDGTARRKKPRKRKGGKKIS